MRLSPAFLVLGVLALGGCDSTPTPQSDGDSIELRFAQVQPFFERYCFGCHGPRKPKGDLDLSHDFSVAAIAKSPKQWDLVRARLQDQEMPPEDAPKRPKPDERTAAIAWLREVSDREARRNAGDPGIVLAHRLSNAEYDYTIRDLTGVDIRPTREFPVDPANEAGFDNSGESLTMSEALLRKYLAAARHVADHVVLNSGGIVFAPRPVVTDTDRDAYCVQRIVAFYRRHEVDVAKYFAALRRYQHRETVDISLHEIAEAAGLSTKYLSAIEVLLKNPPAPGSPVEELWTQWGGGAEPEQLAETVTRLRAKYPVREDKLEVKGISRGSQPFLLWRNDLLAAQHRTAPVGAESGVARFCSVFPDAFVVLERGPYYDKGSSPQGRFLSAGFHLMQGYYRDDGPLYELVLDKGFQAEIDTLWNELHFISQDALRQFKDFIFFERAEPPRFMFDASFDFARSEDKDATSSSKIEQLKRTYLNKAGQKGASEAALKAIEDYFTGMDTRIRGIEEIRRRCEPLQLVSLQSFAARAFRRPLTSRERRGLLDYYHDLRDKDQLSHEDAFRDALTSVLMSPNFLYRVNRTQAGPLTNDELASRLSYFLWSSMPDQELLDSDLRRPEVLTAQARRMLRDPKVRGLATEFAGNWLDFRRFEEHNAVDRDRFPTFTNDLRQSMFEEPIRYIMEVAQENRPLLDLLYGKDTVVNRTLAKHYGMPEPAKEDWVRVEDARPYGRGGLLTMAVFLTKNAPGLRTSPVKRGYWVVRRLLGEQIPPPPPTVPALPKDEAHLGDLTLPQVLARHREDPACAGCHRRFDSVGLVFEGFGPIGERREKDLGGKPVQTLGTFPDGKDRDGLSGLREYLKERRQQDFVDTLCEKLLSYALGRALLPSDRGTLDEMKKQERFDGLVDVIVTCPQFRNRRSQL
ncbi:MAG TPA: DUF1592 domain-containing protein [Planctomycetota bacterium]|nr:DUF1592 domain-containing protein [Planctomycetota bacterium]